MFDPDHIIASFDRTLRVLAGVTRARRASPSEGIAESAGLEPRQREEAAALMRVNHSGEVCAQALYQGQAAATGNSALKAALDRASDEELDHLAWSQERIAELGGRTSMLNPVWYAGSFLIGYAAGKLGDRINLGFLAETERQVERHLQGHLDRLSPGDDRTRVIVEAMAREEAGHAQSAQQLGAAEFPLPVRQAMKLASRVMTTLSYRL